MLLSTSCCCNCFMDYLLKLRSIRTIKSNKRRRKGRRSCLIKEGKRKLADRNKFKLFLGKDNFIFLSMSLIIVITFTLLSVQGALCYFREGGRIPNINYLSLPLVSYSTLSAATFSSLNILLHSSSREAISLPFLILILNQLMHLQRDSSSSLLFPSSRKLIQTTILPSFLLSYLPLRVVGSSPIEEEGMYQNISTTSSTSSSSFKIQVPKIKEAKEEMKVKEAASSLSSSTIKKREEEEGNLPLHSSLEESEYFYPSPSSAKKFIYFPFDDLLSKRREERRRTLQFLKEEERREMNGRRKHEGYLKTSHGKGGSDLDGIIPKIVHLFYDLKRGENPFDSEEMIQFDVGIEGDVKDKPDSPDLVYEDPNPPTKAQSLLFSQHGIQESRHWVSSEEVDEFVRCEFGWVYLSGVWPIVSPAGGKGSLSKDEVEVELYRELVRREISKIMILYLFGGFFFDNEIHTLRSSLYLSELGGLILPLLHNSPSPTSQASTSHTSLTTSFMASEPGNPFLLFYLRFLVLRFEEGRQFEGRKGFFLAIREWMAQQQESSDHTDLEKKWPIHFLEPGHILLSTTSTTSNTDDEFPSICKREEKMFDMHACLERVTTPKLIGVSFGVTGDMELETIIERKRV